MSWDLFLMKKFVGSVNSARVHYSLLTWSTTATEAKREKKGKTQTCIQMDT